MNKLVVVRASPGTGKSYYIKDPKNGLSDAVICSADHYFDKLGRFDSRLLGKAHGECKTKASKAMDEKKPLIVIDNTNIKVRDFMPYVNEARARGYEVEIIRLEHDPVAAAARNAHGVPKDVCLRMARELAESKLPDGLTETVVKTG